MLYTDFKKGINKAWEDIREEVLTSRGAITKNGAFDPDLKEKYALGS